MFCGKCGNEIKDGLAFCPVCGDRFNEIIYNAESNVAHKLNKNMKKRIISIVVAVAVVVGVVGIFRAIFSDSAEDVAIKYIEAVTEGDLNKALKYLPVDSDKYFDSLEDFLKSKAKKNDSSIEEFYKKLEEKYENEYDIDVKINDFSDIFECAQEIFERELKEEYGDDYEISIDITDSEKVSNAKIKQSIKEMKKSIENNDDMDLEFMKDYFDTRKVKEGYKFEVELSIDGDEESDSKTIDIYVAKFDGKWKVIESPQNPRGVYF